MPENDREQTARPPSVGIVGAGLAGLRCADVLLQHGCKVTIFEARDRIGGRVAQSRHLGHLVDLGPNWIHGTKENPIYTIAKTTGTEIRGWDEEEALFDPEGNLIDAKEAEEYAGLLWDEGLIAEAFKYSKEFQDSIDPNRSFYDFLVEKVEGLFSDEDIRDADRKRKTLLRVARMWGAYVGSPVERQSLRCLWLEEVIECENLFVAETYHKILNEVAKGAVAGAELRLNSKVIRISSHENQGGGTASLYTEDGRFDFDEVVVTAPLGWLKRNQQAFDPSLPPRLSQAIDNIGYGTLDKVYITFPSAFWDVPLPERRSAHHSIDPHGTTPNVTAITAPVHQPPDGKESKHYAGFTHWMAPAYASDTNAQGWDQEGMNLAALPESCAHPTLLFYVYGDCAVYIAEIVAKAQSDAERDEKLLQFFKPYFSLLPNFDPANPDCEPTAVLATAWANDEFAGYCSYSNFQIGLEDGARDIETMRYGMPERHIWFAGEHTAPFDSSGTTTGAYVSGEAAAKRIARASGCVINGTGDRRTNEA
ncbi:uncharacterized protein LTR77_005032 [Saxophila tyrrhenica]|uniref:DEP domain-containing protein n=1 Tax=Saxophila tyrrhenica TaxID=1690608 RepID=A0AAV9PAR0_9PEZI|nr:hypothetical protein LTR77_005032 [Saxophila tyrrhenica]